MSTKYYDDNTMAYIRMVIDEADNEDREKYLLDISKEVNAQKELYQKRINKIICWDQETFQSLRNRHGEHDISWEMVLILRVLGSVKYLSAKQIARILAAWKKYFEPSIKTDSVYSKMIDLNLIRSFDDEIRFTRGDLKGKKIRPFFLTRKGKRILLKLCPLPYERPESELYRQDYQYDKVKSGQPDGEMLSRAQHDLLVSEVYIYLLERGDYILSFKNEDVLRSEFEKRKKANTLTLAETFRPQSVSDFEVRFFESSTGYFKTREGEAAVRYDFSQILNKKKYLWWFAYDYAQADKILYYTRTEPLVITEKLLAETKINQKNKSKKIMRVTNCGSRQDAELEEWFEIVGAITIRMAAYLTWTAASTVNERLRKMEFITSRNVHLNYTMHAGRPRVLYFCDSMASDYRKVRSRFALNLALEILVRDGYEIGIEDRRLRVYCPVKDQRYQLIVEDLDAKIHEDKSEIYAAIEKKIEKGKEKNLASIIVTTRNIDAEAYFWDFKSARHIDLADMFPNF